jgi:hypothetical protein
MTPRVTGPDGDPIIIEQINRSAVDEREQIDINLRLRFVRRLVIHTMLAELLAWPFDPYLSP